MISVWHQKVPYFRSRCTPRNLHYGMKYMACSAFRLSILSPLVNNESESV